ncbi:40S ribosomal protein S10 [Melipona quadrifasciata]|uniref:40S ribosomal protein S10 n=1 Tax=Melipona quadrifasciata TaxID=166423 RepID=A0A0N0BGB7_9HYME|nr:40S ribosomal protein S10 [Melipona quadrifasciata]
MLMPKKNRVAMYEYLFKEGVMVAKKDYHAPKHPELKSIPNLEVCLKSKGYVKEQFAWKHFYWYLTQIDCNQLDQLKAASGRKTARIGEESKLKQFWKEGIMRLPEGWKKVIEQNGSYIT